MRSPDSQTTSAHTNDDDNSASSSRHHNRASTTRGSSSSTIATTHSNEPPTSQAGSDTSPPDAPKDSPDSDFGLKPNNMIGPTAHHRPRTDRKNTCSTALPECPFGPARYRVDQRGLGPSVRGRQWWLAGWSRFHVECAVLDASAAARTGGERNGPRLKKCPHAPPESNATMMDMVLKVVPNRLGLGSHIRVIAPAQSLAMFPGSTLAIANDRFERLGV